jgi:hypothetical protein
MRKTPVCGTSAKDVETPVNIRDDKTGVLKAPCSFDLLRFKVYAYQRIADEVQKDFASKPEK